MSRRLFAPSLARQPGRQGRPTLQGFTVVRGPDLCTLATNSTISRLAHTGRGSAGTVLDVAVSPMLATSRAAALATALTTLHICQRPE